MDNVYFIKTEGGYYKVGVALDIDKRLKSLQTSNPHKLMLVAYRQTNHALRLERYIHGQLRKFASGGGTEWFKLSDKEAIKVCILLHKPIPEQSPKKSNDQPIEAEALAVFREAGYASTSLLQRKLGIGYGRAARIVDTLEADGLISDYDGRTRHLIG